MLFVLSYGFGYLAEICYLLTRCREMSREQAKLHISIK